MNLKYSLPITTKSVIAMADHTILGYYNRSKMIEKGLVLKVHDLKAQVRLGDRNAPDPKTQKTALEVRCPSNVSIGSWVRIQLSPPHPIQAKPWELLNAAFTFGIGIYFHHIFLAWLVSLSYLIICFLKISRYSISYEPVILSTQEERT